MSKAIVPERRHTLTQMLHSLYCRALKNLSLTDPISWKTFDVKFVRRSCSKSSNEDFINFGSFVFKKLKTMSS